MTSPSAPVRGRFVPLALGLVLGASLAAGPARAQENDDASLGRVDFGSTCVASVRPAFDRAVALYHHMTYPAAQAAFETIAEEDPACALAYWGMAMTLFQPLWPTRPGSEELERGWALVGEAESAGPGDAREAGFVAAARAFFDPEGEPDYWRRIERWADAQAALFEAFPGDREARAFYALSRLATASRSEDPAAAHAEAAAVLAGILEEEPTHPGAVHYTIHADDFDGREDESLDVVRSYDRIAPRNPHALHMPTHVYVRLGSWDEVIAGNERAAAAALEQRVGPSGAYVWDEFPHATEYLVYAHLQRADDRAARAAIDAIASRSDLQRSFKTAFHLASTEARYALERRDWAAAAALEPRAPTWLEWDRFRWPEAVVWHARGIGAARLGNVAGVAESRGELGRLRALAEAEGEAYFATQIRILDLEVAAWEARLDGDEAGAIDRMLEAVDLEERTPKHPVTPGPAIPAREMLGDLYLEVGDAAAAREAYARSEARAPGRFNAILGLARAAAALGDSPGSAREYRRLLDLAVEGSDRAEIREALSVTARTG